MIVVPSRPASASAELGASGRRARVEHDRHDRLGIQRVAAGSALRVAVVLWRAALEGADGHDDERRKGDERDRQHASTRMRGRLADAKPRDGHRPVAGDGAGRRASQGGRQGQEQRDQQHAAGGKERGRLRHRAGRRGRRPAPIASTKPIANRSQGRPRPVFGARRCHQRETRQQVLRRRRAQPPQASAGA